MTQIGDIFPVEKLTTPKGSVSLDGSAYTVLYFYPKDDTPGCTIEANQFQTLKPAYDKQNIRILGVSVDDADSHAAFCEKFSLAFELVTDKDAGLGTELGILRPSGPRHQRVTWVLDSAGKVVLYYPEVVPENHAQQILDDIAALPS
ncbi:MAG: peroxiredoxin [Candidatus Methylumidiphilus sp.]